MDGTRGRGEERGGASRPGRKVTNPGFEAWSAGVAGRNSDIIDMKIAAVLQRSEVELS
jgi:hypothetical protein